MFIIISSDTKARSRCTSHRDRTRPPPLLPRLRWTLIRENNVSHLHARIRASSRTPAYRCARKEESHRLSDLGVLFIYLDGYPPPRPLLSPFFSCRAPGSSICVPRTPWRIRHAFAGREDRPLRAPRARPLRSRSRFLSLSGSSRQFPRFFRFIGRIAASRDNQQARPR